MRIVAGNALYFTVTIEPYREHRDMFQLPVGSHQACIVNKGDGMIVGEVGPQYAAAAWGHDAARTSHCDSPVVTGEA